MQFNGTESVLIGIGSGGVKALKHIKDSKFENLNYLAIYDNSDFFRDDFEKEEIAYSSLSEQGESYLKEISDKLGKFYFHHLIVDITDYFSICIATDIFKLLGKWKDFKRRYNSDSISAFNSVILLTPKTIPPENTKVYTQMMAALKDNMVCYLNVPMDDKSSVASDEKCLYNIRSALTALHYSLALAGECGCDLMDIKAGLNAPDIDNKATKLIMRVIECDAKKTQEGTLPHEVLYPKIQKLKDDKGFLNHAKHCFWHHSHCEHGGIQQFKRIADMVREIMDEDTVMKFTYHPYSNNEGVVRVVLFTTCIEEENMLA